MKTRDLIRRLQAIDPAGDLECCIGNADILCVYAEPAYWDGCLQVLERDPTCEYYNVVGARYVADGAKVSIQPHSIRDALFDNQDMPVDLSGLTGNRRDAYEQRVAGWRRESRDIHEECERDSFVEYLLRRLAEQHGEDFDRPEVKEAAIAFYDANLSYQDPMPADIKTKREPDGHWASWNTRRSRQWDREIAVELEADGLRLMLNREAGDEQ